jgi:hypothetical protein
MSQPEVATQLYLSPNTVKTHVRNLYGKLGVQSRSQALRRARELRLLAQPVALAASAPRRAPHITLRFHLWVMASRASIS